MSVVNMIALLINALTIALSLFMVILLLWQDRNSRDNLFYSLLLLMTVVWSLGALLARGTAYIGGPNELTGIGVSVLQVGFTGSCLAFYLFTVMLSAGKAPRYLPTVALGMFILLAYQVGLSFLIARPVFDIQPDGTLHYDIDSAGTLFYGGLSVAAIFIAWQQRRKIRDTALLIGVCAFGAGLLIELISPDLRNKSVGLDLCGAAVFVISFALVNVQIIKPLRGRADQLRAVRDVGLAMTSRIRLDEVLSTIAGQAAGILDANGAAIFMMQENGLELTAVHNMPSAFRGYLLAAGEGLAGQVALTRQSERLDNYHRDWHGRADMPFALDTFGAVIAAPLIFANEVMGVLMVIEGSQGKRFNRDDLRLLDLLGPQAAVAITNSRLFERQHALTGELEAANSKLETVLTSTENPVMALNRRFEIIFANPAAILLLNPGTISNRSILDLVPQDALPSKPIAVLRELWRKRVYTYELSLSNHIYLCHIGLLGYPERQGYVVVLNDVSKLKEIDRMKNQMIHMTSHDLKNPLAAAMFHVELLAEEGQGTLTEEMARDVNTIWIQLQRMNRIISGILDLERIQSGHIIMEECAIDQIVRSSVREFEMQAVENGITLRLTMPAELPSIYGNGPHLAQAFNNVIENAVKYTPRGGTIDVKAEAAGGQVFIHVRDTGIGIAYDDQPRIFEQFFRSSPAAVQAINGSGLGLSLVKAVVDAHEGQIWLESAIDKGTVIHMALPTRHAALVDGRRTTDENLYSNRG